MRIIALVKSKDHVCCRYRIAAFRSGWEAQGHEVEVRPWSHGWLLGRLLPGAGGPVDVLIVQRKLFSNWQWALLRKTARRIIFDFDDAIYLHSSYHPAGIACHKRFQQFRRIVQTADAVIAGNEVLRDQACALTDPAKVQLIPTCVDVARYPISQHDAIGNVRLAWIGSSSTMRGLDRARDILEEIGKFVRGVELRIICDRSLKLTNLRVDFRDWSETAESADLAEADIGISWLPNDDWSVGKCGLKVLQYMAAGLPVVANPVGLQARLVQTGETGYLVNTAAEWVAAVRRLAGDPALRRRMGEAGRRRVEAEYDIDCGTARWQNVLRSICDINTPRMELSLA